MSEDCQAGQGGPEEFKNWIYGLFEEHVSLPQLADDSCTVPCLRNYGERVIERHVKMEVGPIQNTSVRKPIFGHMEARQGKARAGEV